MQERTGNNRCGAWSLVGERAGVSLAVPLKCRSWECPRCGPAQAVRLRFLIAEAAPTKFLTLTCSVGTHPDRLAAFEAMRAAWPKLVKRLRRYHGDAPVEFLWVLEATRHGWPHYHVALRMPYTPQALISRWWIELANTRVVHIRAVDSPQSGAWELSKYMTKQLHAPAGFRRWGASAGFLLQRFRPAPGVDESLPAWRLEERSTAALAAEWRHDLAAVLELADGDVLAIALHAPRETVLADVRALLRERDPPDTVDNRTGSFYMMLLQSHATAGVPV